MKAETAAEPRAPLSRDRVLRAAIDLADAQGIEALTMRRLAQALGVEAMSLYYYVPNKQAILNGIADFVLAEIDLPDAGGAWKAALRRIAISAHDSFARHPWAAALILSDAEMSAARLRYMEGILGTLRRAGFSAAVTDHAYHALESHIVGYSLWVAGMNLGSEEDLAGLATEFLAQLPVEEFPYLAEHVEQHLADRDPADEGSFAFGLDLLLDGLERLLAGDVSRRAALGSACRSARRRPQ